MLFAQKNHLGQDIVLDMDDKRFRVRPYQQILSSCTGAILTSLFMTPLDVVKTRLQTQQKKMLSNKCFVYCNGLMDHLCPCPNGNQSVKLNTSVHYNGVFDAFYKISTREGVRSLWSGLSPTLVLAVPSTIVYFVCYEETRMKYKEIYFSLRPDATKQHFTIPLLSGMSARIFSVLVVNPLELIRTKMQSQKLSYYDVGKALKSLVNTEGVLGLWRGLGASLYRDVPFSGIYWAVYESLKTHYEVSSPTLLFSFAGGAIAGSAAALVTTPFDVVKTHKQIEFGEKVLYSEHPQKSLHQAQTHKILLAIYHKNGLRGIFTGVTPRIMKVAPACAIMISAFEHGKSFFFRYNVDHYINDHGLEKL